MTRIVKAFTRAVADAETDSAMLVSPALLATDAELKALATAFAAAVPVAPAFGPPAQSADCVV